MRGIFVVILHFGSRCYYVVGVLVGFTKDACRVYNTRCMLAISKYK